jgi:hypothetical protein
MKNNNSLTLCSLSFRYFSSNGTNEKTRKMVQLIRERKANLKGMLQQKENDTNKEKKKKKNSNQANCFWSHDVSDLIFMLKKIGILSIL